MIFPGGLPAPQTPWTWRSGARVPCRAGPILAKLPSSAQNNEKNNQNDNQHVCGAPKAAPPLCVFSLCFVLFLFAFLFFVCAARDLCHNGTCVAWDPGARAPGPGGLGGWKPPREYHLGSQTRQKIPKSHFCGPQRYPKVCFWIPKRFFLGPKCVFVEPKTCRVGPKTHLFWT